MLLILSACSFWFAELSTIPQTIIQRFDLNRLRPFDCSKCLGFWVGVIYLLINFNINQIYLPILTSLFAIVFSRIYYKLLS